MKSIKLVLFFIFGILAVLANAQDIEIICPEDITHSYTITPTYEEAMATSSCAGEIVVTSTSTETGFSCQNTITKTFTAQDDCDNVATCVQVISIIDDVSPEVSNIYEFGEEIIYLGNNGELDPISLLNYFQFEDYSGIDAYGSEIIFTTDNEAIIIALAGDICGNTATSEYFGPFVIGNCTDESACNYNPLAEEGEEEEGNCTYSSDPCNDGNAQTGNDTLDDNCNCVGQLMGCTDVLSCNFNPDAVIENDSCVYPGDSCLGSINGELDASCGCIYSISGAAFIDDNFNGEQEPTELPLPFQTVTIEELGIQQITDDHGKFNFIDIPDGEYQLSINYTAEWTNYTTAQTQTLTVPQSEFNLVNFGVTSETTPLPTACVDFYPSGAGVPCNDEMNYNICWRNMSPYPISGVVEIQMDDLMSLNYTLPVHDSIVGQSVYWSYEDLGSWDMQFDDIMMFTPDETHFGEFVTNTVIIHAWHDGELLPITERTVTQEITCAYDPNDITGIPEGYTDDHLVLPDTRMEYLIRFQNTGNAPAGQVMVVDTLDSDMDPSTFQLVANSHSVMTTIHPSGRVEFLFENINLPDSTENEPESHGLVSFKIDFRDDVSIGEEINSTSHIFFDNNPAVVTNTTWHTLHECGGEAAFEASATEICRGETVTFTGTNSLAEEHTWNVDAAPSGTESTYSSEFTEAGDYIIQLVAENPLCNASTMQMLTVYDLPEAEITEDGAILTASEGATYFWFLNGELIPDTDTQTYEATEDGSYSVEVTNENGCSTHSEEVMIVNIEEQNSPIVILYPNPMTEVAFIEFKDNSIRTVKLLDVKGKEVRVWNSVKTQKLEIQKQGLATGNYVIQVYEGNEISTVKLVVK